jgi:hypothetical protein
MQDNQKSMELRLLPQLQTHNLTQLFLHLPNSVQWTSPKGKGVNTMRRNQHQTST